MHFLSHVTEGANLVCVGYVREKLTPVFPKGSLSGTQSRTYSRNWMSGNTVLVSILISD